MSDMDAGQLMLACGQTIYLLGKITVKTAMLISKVMNTAYLARWSGQVSLNRFRAIKGDDFVYINVSTEDVQKLEKIEREMEQHGILFARLPDLCGGDGRTQYVISPTDAAKFKTFLLDHSIGKWKDIKIGTVSAEDYARTGYDSRGRETEEMKDLRKSAQQEFNWGRAEGALQPALTGEPCLALPEFDEETRYAIMRHDGRTIGGGGLTWILKEPYEDTARWNIYEMSDGLHCVFVPKSDCFELIRNQQSFHRAALRYDRAYVVVNMQDGTKTAFFGRELEMSLVNPGFRTEVAAMKNMEHNLGVGKTENTGVVTGTIGAAGYKPNGTVISLGTGTNPSVGR